MKLAFRLTILLLWFGSSTVSHAFEGLTMKNRSNARNDRRNQGGFFQQENREPKSKVASGRFDSQSGRFAAPLKKTKPLFSQRNSRYTPLTKVNPKKANLQRMHAKGMRPQIQRYRPDYL